MSGDVKEISVLDSYCMGMLNVLRLWVEVREDDVKLHRKTMIFFIVLGLALGAASAFAALKDPLSAIGGFFAAGMAAGTAVTEWLHVRLFEMEVDAFKEVADYVKRVMEGDVR